MSDFISAQESVAKIVDSAIRKILSGEQKLTKEYEQSVIEAVNVILNTARRTAQPETAKRIVGKSKDGMTLWYQCDMCNEPVDAQDNFCRGCGRRLTDG